MKNIYLDSEYAKMSLVDAFNKGHLMEYLMGNVRPYRRTELRSIISALNDLHLEKIDKTEFENQLKKAEKVAMGRPARKLSQREEKARKARLEQK